MADVDASPEQDATPAAPPPMARRLVVVALWVAPASRERMEQSFLCDVNDDVEQAPLADLIAISTRIPKVRTTRVMTRLRETTDAPIIVVCHAGGEDIAIQLMELGATSIVAEGNERALMNAVEDATPIDHVDADDTDIEPEEPTEQQTAVLVTTFAQKLESPTSGAGTPRAVDPVTGLPTSAAFELRIAELSQRSTLPRLGFVRVANPRSTVEELDPEALELLLRRLSMLYVSVAQRYDAEFYRISDTDFAYFARHLIPRRADELGDQLNTIANSFSPLGTESIQLGVGHAGMEVASDIKTLRDLAQRAVEAAVDQGGGVVGADDLTQSLATTTELEAALKLARKVDELDPLADTHSVNVADYAVEIGRGLGFDGLDLVQLRLAGLLHDVGKVGLDPDVDRDSSEYQSHPGVGERYALLSAGPDVGAAIRHHHERWDGAGFPDALEGEDIPINARILAVADAWDRWSTGPPDQQLPIDEIVERLREESGAWFDHSVVEAALELLDGS
ncbi:MAG: HD domain-containing phosphohydrolase [Actinomycetota bacterium]